MKTIDAEIPLSKLDASHIENLSRTLGEPQWTLELRKKAFTQYESLPWPGPKDEAWRKTNLKLLQWEEMTFPLPGTLPNQPEAEKPFHSFIAEENDENVATAQVRLGRSVEMSIPQATEKEGAEWLSLKKAIEKKPEAVQKAWEDAIVKGAGQKFLLLTLALAQEGICLFLPKNVKGNAPFKLVQRGVEKGRARFNLQFIFAGEGSENTVWEELGDIDEAPGDNPAYVSTFSGVNIDGSARLNFIRLQHWPEWVNYFHFRQINQGRDSKLNTVSIDVGSGLFRNESKIDLTGSNAENKVLGVLFGGGKQIFENWITQNHRAKHTTSDIQYRGVLQDHSRSFFSGMVDIIKSAQQSDAYQSFKGLLLSSDAEAEAIPNLEILADDVKCSHGAAVGPVDEDQKYYLQTRGVPPKEAEKIIIQGFFEPVIAAVPSESVQEKLRQFIEAKLNTA